MYGQYQIIQQIPFVWAVSDCAADNVFMDRKKVTCTIDNVFVDRRISDCRIDSLLFSGGEY